jgi:hypothetical protein
MIKCHSQYWSIKTSTHWCVSFSQQNNKKCHSSTINQMIQKGSKSTHHHFMWSQFTIFHFHDGKFLLFFWGGEGRRRHFTLVFWKFIPITLQQKCWIWMKLLVIERHEISTLPVTKIWGLKPQSFVNGPMVPNCLKSNSITNYAVIMFFPRQLKTFVLW